MRIRLYQFASSCHRMTLMDHSYLPVPIIMLHARQLIPIIA